MRHIVWQGNNDIKDSWPESISTTQKSRFLDPIERNSESFLCVGGGFVIGLGCTTGWIRVGTEDKITFNVSGGTPTVEEAERVRDFLMKLYPDNFNNSDYEMDA